MQLRVLGAGQGLARNANGTVTDAGFIVGAQQPSGSGGALGDNVFANATGVTGSVYMLGCFMSESLDSTYLSDAGLQNDTTAVPIIRGVLFFVCLPQRSHQMHPLQTLLRLKLAFLVDSLGLFL
jgi:hypothetical protein